MTDEQEPTVTTDAIPAGPVGDDTDTWDDYDDFVPPAPRARKLPALTLALAACAIAGIGVLGGVLIQKHWGTSTSSGAQGLPNFAALANRAGATTGSGATGAGAAGNGAAGRGFPGGLGNDNGTVGTVKAIDGNAVYVTDLQGNVVKVTTSRATTITVTDTGKVTDLSPGDTVTVQGTKTASGWNATSLSEGGGFGGLGAAGNGPRSAVEPRSGDGSSSDSTQTPALPGLGG